jgi:hypothetical protein
LVSDANPGFLVLDENPGLLAITNNPGFFFLKKEKKTWRFGGAWLKQIDSCVFQNVQLLGRLLDFEL